MKASQRAQSIAPFLAMEFGKHAAELEAAGHRVIKLNLGEPDFGAPPAVLTALQRVAQQAALPYTSALGLPALREAIAGFYQSMHGVTIAPERIVVTAGASAALLLVTAALVDPGDEVLVGDPSYPCNRQFLSGFGANVRLVPTTAASRFQLDLGAVQRHWSTRTQGLMLATPSNPTGTSVPAAELAALCNWARRHGAWRIIDEIYLNLSDADAQGQPAQTVLAVDPDAIVINSFSKYFGMTGWRLGWVVAPQAYVRQIEKLAQHFFISPSTPAQHAALAAFTPATLEILEERRHAFAARRNTLLPALRELGFRFATEPQGAFYLYADISDLADNSEILARRLIEDAGVATTPGIDFGDNAPDRHLRIAYTTGEARLVEAAERIARVLRTG